MKKPLFALFLAAALAPGAFTQTSEVNARSEAVLLKIHKLDALIQIVPLALTKEQIPPILSAIEKGRQKWKDNQAVEAKELAELDAEAGKAVDNGVNKGVYPPREVQAHIAQVMAKMGEREAIVGNEIVDLVYDACNKTLNAGQLKAMEKSLKPELLDPSLHSDQMDSTAKIKFFIRKVFLVDAAYDVLLDMSKKKDD